MLDLEPALHYSSLMELRLVKVDPAWIDLIGIASEQTIAILLILQSCLKYVETRLHGLN